MTEEKKLRCIWCGTYGGYANRLYINQDSVGDVVAECDWCSSTEYYRRLAANGKGN